jgi:hypothetical protein
MTEVVADLEIELKKKGVKDLTYAELSRLDVGSWKGDGRGAGTPTAETERERRRRI